MCLIEMPCVNSDKCVGVLRKFRPALRAIPADLAAKLPAEDLRILLQASTHPTECLYYPIFRRGACEIELISDGQHDPASKAVQSVAARIRSGVQQLSVRLSNRDERFLFLRYNYCRHRLMRRLKELATGRWSLDAAREIIRWERLARQTRELLVSVNRPLVMAMIERTRSFVGDVQDLIGEGNIALVQSVNRFDCARGFRFSTYACRSIIAAFSRMSKRVSRQRRFFPTEFDQTTDSSLFVPFNPTTDGFTVEELAELTSALRTRMEALTEREMQVIRGRFGFDDASDPNPRRSLRDIAERIGLSTERVRQIQNQALAKLRESLLSPDPTKN